MRVMRTRRLAIATFGLVAGLVAAPSLQAQSLGRLFSSPEERFQLDEIRREYEYGSPVEEETTEVAETSADPIELQLTINGLVVRSSGTNSTWVNGSRVSRGESTREGIKVRDEAGGEVRITLPSGIDTVKLKPGQKIDVASGVILDAYESAPEAEAESAFDLEALPDEVAAEVLKDELEASSTEPES